MNRKIFEPIQEKTINKKIFKLEEKFATQMSDK